MILSRGVFFLSLQENLEFLAPFDCYFKKKKKSIMIFGFRILLFSTTQV